MRAHLKIPCSIVGALICITGGDVTYAGQACEYLSAPLDEMRPDAYRVLLKDELITSAGDCGVFLMMTAGLGEWAVSASTVESKESNDRRAYSLSYTSAVRNLFDSKISWDRTDVPIKITRVDLEIDKTFALAIQTAWRAILLVDHSATAESEGYVTVDGYSADLSVRMEDGRIVARRTLNPQAPPASEIVNLGFELRDYCLRPVEERPTRQREIIGKISKLCELLEKCRDEG